jgi:hypothetical protein
MIMDLVRLVKNEEGNKYLKFKPAKVKMHSIRIEKDKVAIFVPNTYGPTDHMTEVLQLKLSAGSEYNTSELLLIMNIPKFPIPPVQVKDFDVEVQIKDEETGCEYTFKYPNKIDFFTYDYEDDYYIPTYEMRSERVEVMFYNIEKSMNNGLKDFLWTYPGAKPKRITVTISYDIKVY